MKNKTKLLIAISFFVNFLLISLSNADDFVFETKKIEIFDNGNTIIAIDGRAKSKDGTLTIDADKFTYNKVLSTLEATGNVLLDDKKGLITIYAKNIFYNQNSSLLEANTGVVINDLSKDLTLSGNQIFYNIQSERIHSDKKVKIIDKFENTFISESLIYEKNKALVKITGVNLIDRENNNLFFNKAFLNLNTNKFLAKDILMELDNSIFSKENDPRLKGATLETDNENTIIKKGVFTTCKKNDDCPPWQLSAREITHNKENKTIYYKDAWLKLYNAPVFYFPKFFHADPSVKRRSGFLTPSFTNSNNLGSSFKLPYYFVAAGNKDLTLSPTFYENQKQLIQAEYRSINKDSSINLDSSLLNQKNKSSKTHFFSKLKKTLNIENFESSNLELQVQQTSDDTFLKTYKLKSPLITDNTTLTSSLGFDAYREDLSLNLDFTVYEDLSKKNSDRYEYIYPNYNLMKKFNSNGLDGSFSFNSMGYVKNYNTNTFESVAINDLIYDSNYSISSIGLKNNYKLLLKNTNTNSKNSPKYKSDPDHKLASMVQYNSSLPFKKEDTLNESILMPLASLKFSPNKSKNINNNNRKINIDNIFGFNRLGVNEDVEEGLSLTYGVDYYKTNKKENRKFFRSKVANNIRYKESDNLPTNNGLKTKTSDFMGIIEIDPFEAISLGYKFAVDENLQNKNSETLTTALKINNFATSFEYFNENYVSGKNSYLDNTTTYKINKDKELVFKTRENKETSITEFYNLVYRYQDDCLIAAIEYNKDYYSDRDLKPEENIFFKLTIIPIGTNQSPNLLN